MIVGGDIIEITFNHPTIGSGVVYPKSGEDNTLDLGGFRSDDDANGIDGGGNMIDKMKRTRPSFEGTFAWDMNQRQELEKLVALAESPVPASFTFSHINGSVYGGTGKPVGDLKGNQGNATIAVKIAGENKFKKIV